MTVPSSTTPSYVFLLRLTTDDGLSSVQFQAPGGSTTYTIPSDASKISGTVETYHTVQGKVHTWEYWDTSERPVGPGDLRERDVPHHGELPEQYAEPDADCLLRAEHDDTHPAADAEAADDRAGRREHGAVAGHLQVECVHGRRCQRCPSDDHRCQFE